MDFLYQMVFTTTMVLLILFIGFTVLHYFFYLVGFIIFGKENIIKILSKNTAWYNLLIVFYILILLPLLIATFLGLIDSLGLINLNKILTTIDPALSNNIEYSIYRTIALFISFSLVLINLFFLVRKKYIYFIKQLFIKFIE